MTSDTALSESKEYDVVIVGGGVYGAVIARECARIGYDTALIEKDEFAQNTSANSLNILHGGLRYLQHLNISRMRRSIYSRRYFQQISPTTINSLPFLTPTHGRGINGPAIMRIGLFLNDLISLDRNSGIKRTQHIAGGSVISRNTLLGKFPDFRNTPVNGAALWHEAVMSNACQLVNDTLDSAKEHGATIVNKTEAIELLHDEGHLTAVLCKTAENKLIKIKSRIVIDTSGRTSQKLGEYIPGYQKIQQRWARAVNMLVDKHLFDDYAMGLKYSDTVVDKQAKFNSGNRHLFFVPKQGGSAIGTFYENENTVNGDLTVNTAAQQKYLDAVNSVLPEGLSLSEENITGWQSGWLPLDDISDDTAEGELNFAKASRIRSIESNGKFSGLIEVRSVKYTTAPAVARDVVKLLKKTLHRVGAAKSLIIKEP
jgi:glycerol-3-phosphate dehydrogenase